MQTNLRVCATRTNTPFTRIGLELEKKIIRDHAQTFRLAMCSIPADSFVLHAQHSDLVTAVDGLSWCGILIEIKTVGCLPVRPHLHHTTQVLFSLAVTGLRIAHLVYALRDNPTQRRVFALHADLELQESLVARMLVFKNSLCAARDAMSAFVDTNK